MNVLLKLKNMFFVFLIIDAMNGFGGALFAIPSTDTTVITGVSLQKEQSNRGKTSLVSPKIAFISAIYGPYEVSCKPFVKQTIPADFICFTNCDNIEVNEWIIDKNPYHTTNPCLFDTKECINSISNNKHTFNIAKYYKQNFQDIPRLKNYDVVIWLDGSIQITNPKVAEWVVKKIKENPIITWEHVHRNGKLQSEALDSNFYRYTSTFWFGQHQPYQDVVAQYNVYVADGYNDDNYWSQIEPNRPHFGVWVTCFVAFDNKNNNVTKFLNLWYEQTLRLTTQDQIGFPYVAQKLKMAPYTLPDSEVKGEAHSGTDFFLKHNHAG